MAFVAPLIPYITAAIGVVSAISQGKAQSDAAKYNEEIARQNAAIARQQGEAAAAAQQREAARKMSQMRAGYGASGVDVGSGSPLDVLSDSASQAELDVLNTKYNYALRANSFDNQAQLEDAKASNATTTGYLNAAGSALGAAGRGFGGSAAQMPSTSSSSRGGIPLPSVYNTEYY